MLQRTLSGREAVCQLSYELRNWQKLGTDPNF